jgi:hypothetical protein
MKKYNLIKLLESELTLASKIPNRKEIYKSINNGEKILKIKLLENDNLLTDDYSELFSEKLALKINKNNKKNNQIRYIFFSDGIPYNLSLSPSQKGESIDIGFSNGKSSFDLNALIANTIEQNYDTTNHKDISSFFKKIIFCIKDYCNKKSNLLFTFSGINNKDTFNSNNFAFIYKRVLTLRI